MEIFCFSEKCQIFFSSGSWPGMVVCCCRRQLPRKIGFLRAKNRGKKSYHLENRPFSSTSVTVEQIAQSQGPITNWLPRKIIDLQLTIMSTFMMIGYRNWLLLLQTPKTDTRSRLQETCDDGARKLFSFCQKNMYIKRILISF